MRAIWIITKRELSVFFNSLMAYIVMGLFLGFSGFFTWIYGNDIFMMGQASLEVFYTVAFWTLFFFIPAITMKMLAEEKRSGTLELLLTKNVTDRDVIVGKFLATLILIIVTLVLTLIYPLTVSGIGNLENGSTITGYLALVLMSMVYISIGLFASSLTSNQIVAYLTALFIGLFFQIIFGVLATGSTGVIGEILHSLSLHTHFESMSRGVVDSKDIIYFLSLTFLGLAFAEISLKKR
ncbi:MAG: ABC transporter permease subunit [Bacteroidales bacterium]|jgi:ABC-2 type transport system permease protein